MQELDLIPDIGVLETWEFLTDILTSHNGTEQRIALRDKPRLFFEYSYSVIDLEERRQLQEFVDAALTSPTVWPLFQYATPPTSDIAIGSTLLQVSTVSGPFEQGKRLVLLDLNTFDLQTTTISSLTDTTITIADTTDFALSRNSAVIVPAVLAFVEDGVGGNLLQVSGSFGIKARSFQDLLSVQRAGSAASLTTLNGFPVLERQPSQGVQEKHLLPRELLDTGTAPLYASTRYPHTIQTRNVSFLVRTGADPTDLDYWRLFIDTTKGAFKPFLMSTQVPDLSVFTNPVAGSSTLQVNERLAFDRWVADGAFAHIEIEYGDGTTSQHEITAVIDNTTDIELSLSPANVNDARVDDIARISYLVKYRMSDTIRLRHESARSRISFAVRSTDQG